MLHQGMPTLVLMEEGEAEGLPHIPMGTLVGTLAMLRLVVIWAVDTVLMEAQGGTVSCKEGQAGVLLLVPTSLHSMHPWKSLPGMHIAADSFFSPAFPVE